MLYFLHIFCLLILRAFFLEKEKLLKIINKFTLSIKSYVEFLMYGLSVKIINW